MPRVLNTLDLSKNQIINVVVHNVTTLPASPAGGQIVYHDNKFKYWNGTIWVTLVDSLALVTGGKGIAKRDESGTSYFDADVDEVTLTINPSTNTGKITIKALGVDTAQLKDNAVTTIKITDKNITYGKIQDVPTMTVLGRVLSGAGPVTAITILNSNDMAGADGATISTSGSIKAYVDSRVASIGSLQGSYNASTQTTFPAGSKKGDYWYVSVAGTSNGIVFNVGDVLIANQDAASTTDPNQWIFLETNRDQATTSVLGLVMLATQAEARAMTNTTKALTPSNLGDVKATDAETQTGTATDRFITPANLSSRTATEARTGIAKVATQALVNAGINDTDFVTPLKLKAYFDAAVGGYAADIGNGSATTFTVTHGLNTLDVVAELFAKLNGESVIADVSRTTTTAVSVSFSTAPTLNQYRIVIKK